MHCGAPAWHHAAKQLTCGNTHAQPFCSSLSWTVRLATGILAAEERERVYLTEWWPSSLFCVPALCPPASNPAPLNYLWRLYPSILYPRQLLPLVPFTVSPFLSNSLPCLVFSLSNLILHSLLPLLYSKLACFLITPFGKKLVDHISYIQKKQREGSEREKGRE